MKKLIETKLRTELSELLMQVMQGGYFEPKRDGLQVEMKYCEYTHDEMKAMLDKAKEIVSALGVVATFPSVEHRRVVKNG